jgi:hypothetical protein
MNEDQELERELAHDRAIAERLMCGEDAFEAEHLYFGFGDIGDVYLAREPEAGSAYRMLLLKCDPMQDTDAELATREAVFAVTHTGEMHMLVQSHMQQFLNVSVRDFLPFGTVQLTWLMQGKR